ncbi:hypothetical protein K493DRAFT_319458 [Basidiobolus meristosporus CBS 931.73]|uniref:Uncharacterized protein n=1 Tax=Basidiobolus meristosporus CBS 931.73 TaxID=1314790 RepID=A0A1Y1XRR4_9FUNG|nr:hypothetical protein K493DRAFT_319458 [Basidiobolus meristosporus CBS 931.73]|eukprot:ORX88452.1 hypothetical protein K493DRAFT_319458 [Basidiobolus meristosporus CBS 931.73]
MPAENKSNKSSLKRRLSGIFLPENGAKISPPETPREKSPVLAPVPSEVAEKPSRRFFSFPSYLKKSKPTTAPLIEPVKITAAESPVVITVAKNPARRSVSDTTIPKVVNDAPVPQHAYKVSLQKLQQSARRPLVQVLLIHQTITKATIRLKSEGIHPAQLAREQRLAAAKSVNRNGPISRRRSYPMVQRLSTPPPPYSSVEGKVVDKDDNVPLGVLQRGFLKPAPVSVLVA